MKEDILIYNSSNPFLKGSPLSTLEIEAFRNLKACRFSSHPKFNFFYGNNAQGKTSFIEAIYFLSELKSFRSQDLEPLISHNCDIAYLRAELCIHGIAYDIKSSINAEGKEVFLNGKKPRPYSKIRQIFPMVLFTPDSIRLFRSSPGDRRSYFDRLFSLLSEDYEKTLDHYQKTLKQKQVLLDQYLETGNFIQDQLDVWNQKIAIWGAELTFHRYRWAKKLEEKLNCAIQDLSKGEWKSAFKYEPYLMEIREEDSVDIIEKKFIAEMEKRQRDELVRGQALVGPHRDDWVLSLGGHKLKEEGSQGQHRVSVAALKLSEVSLLEEMGKTPVALFDDLLSELDYSRSQQMLETLSSCRCQVFLTSVTPLGLSLKGLEGMSYEVKNGKLINV